MEYTSTDPTKQNITAFTFKQIIGIHFEITESFDEKVKTEELA